MRDIHQPVAQFLDFAAPSRRYFRAPDACPDCANGRLIRLLLVGVLLLAVTVDVLAVVRAAFAAFAVLVSVLVDTGVARRLLNAAVTGALVAEPER